MDKLKVGLVVDSGLQSQQTSELVKLAFGSENYEFSLIYQHFDQNEVAFSLVNKVMRKIRRKGLKSFLRSITFKGVLFFERITIAKLLGFMGFFKRVSLNDFGLKEIHVYPEVSKSGLLFKYSDLDIEKIKNEGLDLLIRGGSGILQGKILTVCDFGVFSFHHGDNNINRGGPPGFWEVYFKQDRTGFVIQKLSDELDGGEIIYRGWIVTSPYYSENLMRIKSRSNLFMHKAIEKLALERSVTPVTPKIPYSGPLYKVPNVGQQIRYVFQIAIYVISRLVRKILRKRYEWFVGYQFVSDWNDVSLRKFQIIKNPKDRFLADPFVIKHEDSHYLFVEDFDYKRGRGRISVLEVRHDSHSFLGVALEENFHLSYPFVFEHDNEFYMCPETHETKDIRLYKCVEFPLKWELKTILMTEICAADTSIFKMGSYWWLLTNSDASGLSDHSSELNIYYSEDLFSSSWTPHPKNPVIFDSSRARNGGLIKFKGDIFRVFQRQGWDCYGQKFGVAKITLLNQISYEEIELWDVTPQFLNGILGAHTFNFDGGLAVTDFLKIS